MIHTAVASPARPAMLLLIGLSLTVVACTTDFSGPGADCGDGEIQTGETCDDTNTASGDGCSSSCQVEDGWTCQSTPSECETECGDGVARGTEACDASDLRSLSCSQLGLGDGTLACGPTCVFDTSGCELQSVCGNGAAEPSEDCDGDDLAGARCEDLGLGAGVLSCTPECEYDVSECSTVASCGNGVVEFPEVCDGADLSGQSCTDQGFYGGTLTCRPDCSSFDTDQCGGVCGDDVANGPETCDGADLGGQTCVSLGCRSGTLTCASDCTPDLSGCQDGHDEDGDGVDDNCDNCPAQANPSQVNGDGDDVGNVCEAPTLSTLLSTIAVFDPLLTVSAWTETSSTWTPGVDEVTGSKLGTGGTNYLHADLVPNVDYCVEATFHYAQNPPSGSNWAGLIFARTDVSGQIYAYVCVHDRVNDTVSVWRADGGGVFNLQQSTNFTTSVQDQQWHRMRAYRNGDNVRCIYDDETGATAQVHITGGEVWADMSGQVGLRVYNEAATFTSFVVYQ